MSFAGFEPSLFRFLKQLRRNNDREWFEKNKIPMSFQIVGFHDTFVNNLETQQDLDFVKKQKIQLVKALKKLSKPKSLGDFSAYYWRDLLGMYRDGKPRTTPCPFQKDQFVLDSDRS